MNERQDQNPQQTVEGRLRSSVESQYKAGSGKSLPSQKSTKGIQASSLLPWLAILVLGCGIGLVFWLHLGHSHSQDSTVAELNQKIENLTASLDQMSEGIYQKVTIFGVDLAKVQEQVGLTQSQIDEARQLAEKVRAEKQREVASLTSQLLTKADSENLSTFQETSNSKFGQIDQELSGVKTDIETSRETIEKTVADLAALGLNLTEQGKLVAVNGEGIQELVRRGERDYVEFGTQRKRRISMAGIALELRKAEYKKNRADIRLFFDDKRFNHNDVYTNTPLTFLVGPDKTPYELVINEVKKDHISGYIGLPKGALSDSRSLGLSRSGE